MFDDILHWQLLLLAVLQVSLLSVDVVVVAVATTAIESETTTLTRGQQQQKRRETDKLHNLLRTRNIEQTILCCHG